MSTADVAIVWASPRSVRVRQSRDRMALGPGRVRIEITSAGICGTDLGVWSGSSRRGVPGTVLGHEFGGRVIGHADEVTGVQAGDLVAVDPNLSCGSCDHCRSGARARCANRRLMGVDLDGGFQTTVDVAATQLIPAPRADPRALALVEPLAVGIHAVTRAGVGHGDRVGVIGGGPIGMACVVEAVRRGAVCIVLEVDEARRQAIIQTGIDAVAADAWPKRGLDAVVDTVGRATTVQSAMNAVHDGGTVCIVGLSHDDRLPAPDQLVRREVTLTGSFCYTTDDLHLASRTVEDRGLDVIPTATTIGWDAVPELLERLAGGQVGRGKALVIPIPTT